MTVPPEMLAAWAKAFIVSLAIELPVFILMFRKELPAWRSLLGGGAGTFFTHPLIWFVWPRFFTSYSLYLVSGELLVAVIEGFIFFLIARPKSLARSLAASFFANSASYGLGALITALK